MIADLDGLELAGAVLANLVGFTDGEVVGGHCGSRCGNAHVSLAKSFRPIACAMLRKCNRTACGSSRSRL